MMGIGFISLFWSIQLGVLGILDSRLFKTAAEPGKPRGGAMAWTIIVLVVAGLSGLWGLWGLFGSIRSIGFISHFPLFWILSFLTISAQLALSVFMILGAIKRLGRKAPGMGLLKLIFGIVVCALAVISVVAQRFMYY
jgi:hypothetical protein